MADIEITSLSQLSDEGEVLKPARRTLPLSLIEASQEDKEKYYEEHAVEQYLEEKRVEEYHKDLKRTEAQQTAFAKTPNLNHGDTYIYNGSKGPLYFHKINQRCEVSTDGNTWMWIKSSFNAPNDKSMVLLDSLLGSREETSNFLICTSQQYKMANISQDFDITIVEDGKMYEPGKDGGKKVVFPGVAKITQELIDEKGKRLYVLEIDGQEGTIPATDFESTETLRKFIGNLVGVKYWCDNIKPRNIKEISRDAQIVNLVNASHFKDGKYIVRGWHDEGMIWKNDHQEHVFNQNCTVAKEQVKEFYRVYGIKGLMVLIGVLGNYATIRFNERMFMFLIGETGSGKTAMMVNALRSIGDWNTKNITNLAGDGATENAIKFGAYQAGIGPYPLDDVKIVDSKDENRIIRLVHSLYQGSGKKRMQKSSDELRESQDFDCGVILTGETKVESQSALSRLFTVNWEAQDYIEGFGTVPVDCIGTEWLRYLESADMTAHIDVTRDTVKYVNSARINEDQIRFLKVWYHFMTAFGLHALNDTMIAEIKQQIKEKKEALASASEGVKLLQMIQLDPQRRSKLGYSADGNYIYIGAAYISELCKRGNIQKISFNVLESQLQTAGYQDVKITNTTLAGMTKQSKFLKMPAHYANDSPNDCYKMVV